MATVPFVGGIRQYGYQCGQIWGASLGAGARVYQKIGSGSEAETRTMIASEKLVESFRQGSGEVNCHEITSLNKDSTGMDMVKYFLLKGGSVGCFKLASHFAPKAYDAIEESLDQERVAVPKIPVSCTSLLARKMSASEKHQTMVAGLAGGIGLCGEACGALGTAVWIHAMKLKQEHPESDLWKDERFGTLFESLVQTFLEASDYEFECQDIVGRKFENTADHAEYLRKGGCSRIIDALSTTMDSE